MEGTPVPGLSRVIHLQDLGTDLRWSMFLTACVTCLYQGFRRYPLVGEGRVVIGNTVFNRLLLLDSGESLNSHTMLGFGKN